MNKVINRNGLLAQVRLPVQKLTWTGHAKNRFRERRIGTNIPTLFNVREWRLLEIQDNGDKRLKVAHVQIPMVAVVAIRSSHIKVLTVWQVQHD